MAYVFSGGIFFKNDRNTFNDEVKRVEPPRVLYVPIGSSQTPPQAGTRVLCGQLIADSAQGEAAVHAPITGIVEGTASASGHTCVVIRSDGSDELSPDIKKMNKKLADCDSGEIIEKIRLSGVVGADDGIPTSEKLLAAVGKTEMCVINCAECEPYVSCDIAAASSTPAAVVNGLKIFLRALGIRRGIIAVSENAPSVAKRMSSLTRGSSLITVQTVSAKYPQGNERRLAYAITGRELQPHADPISVGCVIFNVRTCIDVYNAFVTGMPLTKRVVSVGGDCLGELINLEVPIGTKFSELFDMCVGNASKAGKASKAVKPSLILDGGPLTGRRSSKDGVVRKTTRAVLFFSQKSETKESRYPVCINCGKCAAGCPEGLLPNYIYNYIRDGKTERAISRGALDCVGCGICSYVCPGKAPVTELIADFRINHKDDRTNGAVKTPRSRRQGDDKR